MDSFQRASREKDQQRQVEVALEETREKYKQLQDENKKLMMVRLTAMMGPIVDFPVKNLTSFAQLTAFLVLVLRSGLQLANRKAEGPIPR